MFLKTSIYNPHYQIVILYRLYMKMIINVENSNSGKKYLKQSNFHKIIVVICYLAVIFGSFSQKYKKIIKIMHIPITKLKQSKKIALEQEALDTQTSVQSGAHCEIKSKFFKNWAKREIIVNLEEELLYIFCNQAGRKKSYPLNQVSYSKRTQQNIIKLRVCPTRSYQVKSNPLIQQVLKDIDYYHRYQKMQAGTYQLMAPKPQKINYQRSIEKLHQQSLEKKIIAVEPEIQKKTQTIIKQKSLHDYERQVSYIKLSDWKRDHKNGGLILFNKQKKSLIPKMISYSAKKVLSSGSFVNINFPTFAMKPESGLETYCKSLGSVPILLDNVQSSPLQRMKAFNVALLTMSILTNDIEKPFNPVIGQTFQGEIGGNQVYAEQISIKPDISSFLLVGKNYKLYGNLQLKANVGLNQAVGVFHGKVFLEFEDGMKITGIMPKGVMTGVLFGETCFGPTGAVYTYDAGHKLVCSFETKKGDVMVGQIGKLKESGLQKFLKNMKEKSEEEFPHVPEKDYQTILSKIHVIYTDSISYDGKLYFSYSSKHNLPIKMTKNIKGEQILLSDSNFREDIRLRKLDNMKDSQDRNEQLEIQEERLRKLRKTNFSLKH